MSPLRHDLENSEAPPSQPDPEQNPVLDGLQPVALTPPVSAAPSITGTPPSTGHGKFMKWLHEFAEKRRKVNNENIKYVVFS